MAYIAIAITTCVILLEVSIVVASSRGTIKNSYPRRLVPHLLHFRLFVLVLEIVSLLAKTVLAAQPDKLIDYTQCPDINTAVIVARAVVAITWLIFLSVLIAVLVYLDPCHLYSARLQMSVSEDTDDGHTHVWHLTHSAWERRFKLLCCFAGSDESHQIAYREVAEIFAHLFHDSNLVLSDIAAGMVLLQKEHLEYERRIITSNSIEPSRSIVVNFRDSIERKLFSDSFHYLTFALGVYAWSLHIYMNPTWGCCQVLSRASLCCCRRRPKRKNIHGDNSCFCGFAGFMAMTSLDETDVLYARFENDVYRAPFVVCLDHDQESVVIAIRGTLSLHDIITDLTASTHPIQLPDWPEFAVHRGMHQTAMWIKQCLEEEEVLEKAFAKVPRYKLVLTGHSLGSGCAGILAILLREAYPDLHCYCFSPTGSLLNAEAAAYTQSFITSVTLGQDLVCRLSVRTAHQLTRDLIRVLENSHKPKYRILCEGALETIGKCCGRDVLYPEEQLTEPLPAETDDSDTEERTNLSSPLLLTDSNPLSFETCSDEETLPVPSLYPPGRIIHIVDTLEERHCFFAQRQLEARWSAASSFNEVAVSPDMLKDHFPDVLYRSMRAIWEQNRNELEVVSVQ